MKNAVLALAVSLVSLELFSFAATKANLLLFNDYPEIYQPRYSGFKWRTQKELWGSWHKVNATDRHQSTCFDVRYASNEIGARDTAFQHAKPDGKTRYLLIGDSFAEGYGANFQDIAQSQLEKLTGIDVYNFGSDGFFGPVQYYLIYKNLAKQFEHDGVILFFLPANDFTDNDYTFWKNYHGSWYRPYYKKLVNGGYDIFYPAGAVPSDQYDEVEENTLKQFLIQNLIRYTFTANTVRTIKYLLASTPVEKLGYSGYFDATREQQEAALYFIEKLVQESAPRPVTILVIPNREDMNRIRSGKSYKDQYWLQKLHSMAASGDIALIDMADHMPGDYASLFLPCDNHWNALGHLTAAKLIAAEYRSSTSRNDTGAVVSGR
ncbi:MAG TPA: SGNH/GDSL hydrolase family protein [Phototrophicaceae bacterium]|nr:SGNH/GDSL hydrolase family protein [Phototrophicaceae bacterium]